MAEKAAIKIDQLVKSYGKFPALRGVTLTVQEGEIFGFLGPNGAGKTTTIRCLLDLIHPNGGHIEVLGSDPQRDPVAVRAHCGYLPGELQLEGNMRGEEALRFFNALRGGQADWPFIRQLAERLDVDLKRRIKNLSRGNKQKIGIIQALMHRPKLLLLDEPTVGLDPLMQQEVLHLIQEAHANGTTLFFSSHIMSEVEAIAQRVGIIRQGKIVEVAATHTLVQRALHRMKIYCKRPVNTQAFAGLPGVKVLTPPGQRKNITLQVAGDMEPLIKVLATLPVRALETERPSLEEIFLAYYEKNEKGAS